jgi:hypothetical protein
LGGNRPQDIYSSARVPVGKTADDVAKALATLRDEGYFKHIGASEVSVDSIKAMQKASIDRSQVDRPDGRSRPSKSSRLKSPCGRLTSRSKT